MCIAVTSRRMMGRAQDGQSADDPFSTDEELSSELGAPSRRKRGPHHGSGAAVWSIYGAKRAHPSFRAEWGFVILERFGRNSRLLETTDAGRTRRIVHS
jgi:hypothetical protein